MIRPQRAAVLAVCAWACGVGRAQLYGYLETEYAAVDWKHVVSGGFSTQAVLSPDGRVLYACYNGPEVNEAGVTNSTGHILAIDAVTGAELWRFLNPDRQPFAARAVCPVVAGDHLLVVSENFDPRQSKVLFIRAADGAHVDDSTGDGTGFASGYHQRTQVNCSYLDPDDRENANKICNYPIPVRYTPVVAWEPFPVMFFTASDLHLYAINMSNSALLPFQYHCPRNHFTHRYKADGEYDKDKEDLRKRINDDCKNVVKNETRIESCPGLPSCTTFGTPPVLSADGKRLLVAASDGQVFCISVTNRSVLWEYEIGAFAVQEPVLTDQDLVIVHGGGRVVALHLANGSEAWPAPFSVPVWTVNSTDGGTSQFGAVYSVYVPRSTSDRYVYVKDDSATIYALDHDTGAEVFRFQMGRRVYTLPTLGRGPSANLAFIGSRNGRIFGLSCPSDGQFVVDRLPYRCEDLSIVIPSQRDLCEELERRCPDPQ